MKILSLGSQYLSGSFRKLGCEVCSVVPRHFVSHQDDISFDFYGKAELCSEFVSSILDKFNPDLIFQGDHSGPLIHTGIEKYSIPKVWYAVDVHLHNLWYKHYAVIFDRVFCAQKNYLDCMSTYTANVEWMPLFYLGKFTEFVPWNKREYLCSFVGTMDVKKNPARVALFDRLLTLGVNVNISTGQYENVYSRSKVVINQSVADDLNLRFFEAAGCGALLINDQLSHSMNDILIPEEDYLVYSPDNIDELLEKIEWVRNNENLAEEMALRAQSKILKGHLEFHRAMRVLDWFQNDIDKRIKNEAGEIMAHLALASDYCSNLSIPQRVAAVFKKNSYRQAAQALTLSSNNDIALLIVAEQAFQDSNYQLASEKLSKINGKFTDVEFEKRFLTMRAMTDLITGNRERAISTLSNLLSKYPDDSDLQKIKLLSGM